MKNAPILDPIGTTCIWGQSQSGKSYLARKMIAAAKLPTVVIIDPLAGEGTDAPGVFAQLKSGSKVIVCNDNRTDHQIGAIYYALARSTLAEPVYVVADEAPSYMKTARVGLSKAVLQGRHGGFGMLLIGQRPQSVLAEYRTQAKVTYWMRLTDHTDVGAATNVLGPERAGKLSQFKQGEFQQWPE